MLSPSTVSSFSLNTKDAESAKTTGSPESLSPDEAAEDYKAHLPFKIPGAMVLSAPSISTLQETANDVYLQLNYDTSYSNQFIIVSNLSQQVQELIGRDRNPLKGVPYRLTLDTQRQRAVIRIIPSGAHKRVTQSFSLELAEKLLNIGIRSRAYTINTATRYRGTSYKKEADQSLTPSQDAFTDKEWPSLVIKTGLSESEAQLRADAH
jgi:hypothetical protein